mmetsp:Transcript_39576/g.95607  ORF Transcript_39576/g.95607 Transcript_39576/m.95607 type:complete len:239 (+) Transcript_39576:99-815(+)
MLANPVKSVVSPIAAAIVVAVLMLLLQPSHVSAYPNQAGSCPAGVSAVNGPHLAQPSRGSLLSGGFVVLLNGMEADLEETGTIQLRSGEAFELQVVASTGTSFRGILARIDDEAIIDLTIPTEETLLQPASVCNGGSIGVTHTSNVDKTAATMTLSTSVFSTLPRSTLLDITVVVVEDRHYYSGFTLEIVDSTTTPDVVEESMSEIPSDIPSDMPSDIPSDVPSVGPSSPPLLRQRAV